MTVTVTVDDVPESGFDPLVPRPIDRPTVLPLTGDLDDLDPAIADRAKIFAAPDDPADWPAWRDQLHRWRHAARKRFPQRFRGISAPKSLWKSEAAWARRCFSLGIVWLWDERLFDHERREFTPDRLLADAESYGGFDAVVLWHAYPVIGLDDRNQFDFYRDVPGLDELVADLQRHDVRVLIDYNPWDVATRREPVGDATMLAELVTALGVDGVFLDTMREGGAELVTALHRVRPQPVLEGESRVPLERIGDHEMSWAQWFADSPVPGVMAAHWFERRHMQHHTRRWNRDHSDELQSSWMNGTGIVVWDAVFGSWVGWNERDKSTLRRVLWTQRALADILIDGEWTPLADATREALAAGVYSSRFDGDEVTLWTLINRSSNDFRGRVLDVDGSGTAWFDICSGAPLPTASSEVLVPARSVGGLLRVAGDVPVAVTELVAANAADARSSDSTFPARLPERIAPPSSPRSGPRNESVVLQAGRHTVDVTYRLRETGMYGGAPFVEEWKPLPPRLHALVTEQHVVAIGNVAVACREVAAPDGRPRTNIGLTEAREYAASLGARLPTEFEWQLAAANPAFQRAEPLVWNWTESEHSDGITRFAILKGGCSHELDDSEWYFDGGPRPPEFSAKLLLAGLGLERSPSIGFRLAWDLDDPMRGFQAERGFPADTPRAKPSDGADG